MKVEHIGPKHHAAALYDEAIWHIEAGNRLLQDQPVDSAKRDEHAADPEVVSLYYLSSLQSLKEIAQPIFEQAKQSADIAVAEKSEKSIVQSVKDWFWGWFGHGTKETDFATLDPQASQSNSLPLGSSPTLQPPEQLDHDRLKKAIADINQTLLWRMKDTQEFEEELRKSSSKKLDKLILTHIKNCSMEQRDLKQISSVFAHEELHQRHKDNKEIQKKTGTIADDLNKGKNIAKSLKWINISLTGGMILGTAMAYFTGGASAVIQVALPLASVLKSGTTLTDGVVKYKNSLREGELRGYKENTRANNATIHDKLQVVQNHDDEIAHVLKSLRKQLKDHSENERLLGRFGKANT